MKEILVDQGFVPGDVKEIICGPAMIVLELWNWEITNPSLRRRSLQAIQRGYKVKFQLLPDVSIGYWDDFKSKFGF